MIGCDMRLEVTGVNKEENFLFWVNYPFDYTVRSRIFIPQVLFLQLHHTVQKKNKLNKIQQ